MQFNRFSTNSFSTSRPLQRCRDGHECQLLYNGSTEHKSLYSHPCRWSELCREKNNNDSEHVRLFTHDPHQVPLCKFGPDDCSKLTDVEHRHSYRHEGLPDFLIPCRFKDRCRDRSTEHAHTFAHPSGSYHETQSFRTTNNSRDNSNGRFAFNQTPCKYGDECYKQSDPEHCSRYSHPLSRDPLSQTPRSSTKSFSPNTQSTPTDNFNSRAVPLSTNHLTSRLPPRSTNNLTSLSPTASADNSNTREASTTVRRSNIHLCGSGNDMERAYRIGGALAMETLSKSDQQAIQNMPDDAVIVVPGSYDHIDRVLKSLNIKYITVEATNLLTHPIRLDQTVYINCSSSFPIDAARRLRQLVEQGLHIITTDWALAHVHNVAFSDFIQHNGLSTADEVVGIEVADPKHPLVSGFLSASQHALPQWWLETGSHPIRIVNEDKVRVLIRSATLGEKYRSDAVLVTFDCGKGNVIHMVSHFYLQRSETRDQRHQMPAKQYAMDIKASTGATNLVASQGQHLNYAQIQSSSTSAQFIYNQLSTRLNSKK
ncbi:unnamed protein product [Adineta ricciae]|uniref:PBZ-type domain-containing protein n=1 Tax=Adineta ricciae TaxID=249248 RepID=A0A815UW60_ADIRI|nr:unnamed protein product [Adineta ricciae]CAF1524783.1 unnamed protein product [Adineta ricciae]